MYLDTEGFSGSISTITNFRKEIYGSCLMYQSQGAFTGKFQICISNLNTTGSEAAEKQKFVLNL
ncbi:MAG: hypothetical protein C0403_07120 [Desulfobacterium sp.]|nr:hypothetical protein [Desulfobacterium sp.]